MTFARHLLQATEHVSKYMYVYSISGGVLGELLANVIFVGVSLQRNYKRRNGEKTFSRHLKRNQPATLKRRKMIIPLGDAFQMKRIHIVIMY